MTDKMTRAKRLWDSIGEIDDFTIEEAELADIKRQVTRRKVIKYSALAAAAASVSVAALYVWARPRRAAIAG